jgi:adenine-specific DNA-methyltransferase
MPRPPKPPTGPRPVETLVHADTRRNIPTAEFQSLAQQMEEVAPFESARYKRATPLAKSETRERNADLDPQIIWRGMRITLTQAQRKKLQETGEVELGDAQLVWRGKDTQDWSDLLVNPPPIYIQEKVQPKAVVEGLRKESRARAEAATVAPDLFRDFNGLDDPVARLEFYQHDQHWSNRMILGDSLQVMASLAEREGLRGKVQCIYFDPPYGIKFNSNWQVSTQSRDVKDGKREDVSREPEQVKAFRDTWKDGIHSYLTYLRDRLTVMRELLTESGSIFVQIGDENAHRVRSVMDEVFGSEQHISTIALIKTTSNATKNLAGVYDSIVWYAKDIESTKYRQLHKIKEFGQEGAAEYTQVELPNGEKRPLAIAEKRGETALPDGARVFRLDNVISQSRSDSTDFKYNWEGKTLGPGSGGWKTNLVGMNRLARAGRLRTRQIGNTITYVRYIADFAAIPIANVWTDLSSGFNAFQPKIYVVQTNERIVERCILMASDPGDLILDPTCGSGTTAEILEQWGRR